MMKRQDVVSIERLICVLSDPLSMAHYSFFLKYKTLNQRAFCVILNI